MDFEVSYYGHAVIDHGQTPAMVPWICASLIENSSETPFKLEFAESPTSDNLILGKTQDQGKTLFIHRMQFASHFKACSLLPGCFSYMLRTGPQDKPHCYVFKADSQQQMETILNYANDKAKEAAREIHLQLWGDVNSKHYEIMFIGKVPIDYPKVSSQLIDRTAEKYVDMERKTSVDLEEAAVSAITEKLRHESGASNSSGGSNHESTTVEHRSVGDSILHQITKLAMSSMESEGLMSHQEHEPQDLELSTGLPSPRDGQKVAGRMRRCSGKNRTMLLRISLSDVCIVSPDRKSVFLERRFTDIASCRQGEKHAEHVSLVVRDHHSSHPHPFLCYVFKCATTAVATELLQSLQTAFSAALAKHQSHETCDTCPITLLQKLCTSIEGRTAEDTYEQIQGYVASLPDEKDKIELLSKFHHISDYNKLNRLFMSALLSLAAKSQKLHVEHKHNRTDSHKSDQVKHGPAAVLDSFKKAKKSLALPFGQLLNKTRGRPKKTSSLQEHDDEKEAMTSEGNTPLQSPRRPVQSHAFSFEDHEEQTWHSRRRSNTLPEGLSRSADISFEPQSPTSPRAPPAIPEVPVEELTTPTVRYARRQSYRQQIFSRVVTPRRRSLLESSVVSESALEAGLSSASVHRRHPLGPARVRQLWSKAIAETVMLIRMEKENNSLRARQKVADAKRNKLDYEEMTPCLKEVSRVWEELLVLPQAKLIDSSSLWEAVKAGVPRVRRGAVWRLLSTQHALRSDHCDFDDVTPYNELLGQLTSHQHAILIDLGRTFPTHPYFSRQQGSGQLALFNVLKAYSLLDTEVGYCQGISFIAGVLLMHTEEEQAFEILRYLMFNMGVREQFKPDMCTLQLQLYQLSRLVHDKSPALHDHLEQHDISPTLYAAPWFLTLFASQFPLGFVSRVFDLLFLQGIEAVFKVALVLLANHKELILQCDSFESVMHFLKTTLPEMGIIQMERVINEVFQLDISQQLKSYAVEYSVLQEDVIPSSEGSDPELVARLERSNRSLTRHNQQLLHQLEQAQDAQSSLEAQLESIRSSQIMMQQKLESLELERSALLAEVKHLREQTSTPADSNARTHPPSPPPSNPTGHPSNTPHYPSNPPDHPSNPPDHPIDSHPSPGSDPLGAVSNASWTSNTDRKLPPNYPHRVS